jgi:hypothetical protein
LLSTSFFYFYTKLAKSSFLCHFLIESVNVFVLPRFDLCHVLFSSTNNFAHAQALSRMSSLSGHMNITRVNIGFFTGFKKIKQQRISFILGYLCMILWKLSTAITGSSACAKLYVDEKSTWHKSNRGRTKTLTDSIRKWHKKEDFASFV